MLLWWSTVAPRLSSWLGLAWGFDGGCVHWKKQVICLAVALTPGQEAAGAQGFLGWKGECLSDEGWGVLGWWQDEEGSLYGGVGRADWAWRSLNFFFFFSSFSVLLESLNKNEQSANGQSQSRESTNSQFKKMSRDFPSANGEAGGEAPKGYTQDQVDAVKRCVHSSPWLQPAACLSLLCDTGLFFTVF